jgi:hypothetical protein
VRSYLFAPSSSASLYVPLERVAERAEKRCEELGLLDSYQDALLLLRSRMLGGPAAVSNGTTTPGVATNGTTADSAQHDMKHQDVVLEQDMDEAEARRRGEQVLSTPHVEGFLQALLLLQEFQKEIAAIMHASTLVAHHNATASPSTPSSSSLPSTPSPSPSTSRATTSSS